MMLRSLSSSAPAIESLLDRYFEQDLAPYLDDLQREFEDTGYARLQDFAPETVRRSVRAEVMGLLDVYAKRREVLVPSTGNTPRYYESVGRDDIVHHSTVTPAVFRSPALLRFLSGLAGETVIPIPYEPEEILITRMTEPGDNHGWHWDDYSFSLCWIMESPPPGSGGETEMVPNTFWDKENPQVEFYLLTRQVVSRQHPRGCAYFLRADTTMHRVTPIDAGTQRIALVLSYATLSDLEKDVTHETIETIYT